MKKLLKILGFMVAFICIIFISLIVLYKIDQPLKLTSSCWMDKKAVIDRPYEDRYFYYDIYNSSKFNVRILNIKFKVKDALIKRIEILDGVDNHPKGFIEFEKVKPLQLNNKASTTILLIAKICGTKAEFENLIIDYELLGIRFKKSFNIQLFAQEVFTDIIKNDLANPNMIIEEMKNSKEVVVCAKDVFKEEILDQKGKEELVKAILKAEPVEYDFFTGQPISPIYPFYEIRFGSYELTMINKNILLINSNKNYDFYKVNENLWNKISLLLEVKENKDDNSLLYLFNAESVKLEGCVDKFFDGDYTFIKENIIRFLMRDIKSKKEIEDLGESMIFKFYINKRIYDVKIYDNGFIYNGVFYEKEGVKKELLEIVKAG